MTTFRKLHTSRSWYPICLRILVLVAVVLGEMAPLLGIAEVAYAQEEPPPPVSEPRASIIPGVRSTPWNLPDTGVEGPCVASDQLDEYGQGSAPCFFVETGTNDYYDVEIALAKSILEKNCTLTPCRILDGRRQNFHQRVGVTATIGTSDQGGHGIHYVPVEEWQNFRGSVLFYRVKTYDKNPDGSINQTTIRWSDVANPAGVDAYRWQHAQQINVVGGAWYGLPLNDLTKAYDKGHDGGVPEPVVVETNKLNMLAVSSDVGPRDVDSGSKFHPGLDIPFDDGNRNPTHVGVKSVLPVSESKYEVLDEEVYSEPVYAMHNGRACASSDTPDGIIELEEGNGSLFLTRYVHLNNWRLLRGTEPGSSSCADVVSGQLIGYTGARGGGNNHKYEHHLHVDRKRVEDGKTYYDNVLNLIPDRYEPNEGGPEFWPLDDSDGSPRCVVVEDHPLVSDRAVAVIGVKVSTGQEMDLDVVGMFASGNAHGFLEMDYGKVYSQDSVTGQVWQDGIPKEKSIVLEEDPEDYVYNLKQLDYDLYMRPTETQMRSTTEDDFYFIWNTEQLEDGPQSIFVYAQDIIGNEASQLVTIGPSVYRARLPDGRNVIHHGDNRYAAIAISNAGRESDGTVRPDTFTLEYGGSTAHPVAYGVMDLSTGPTTVERYGFEITLPGALRQEGLNVPNQITLDPDHVAWIGFEFSEDGGTARVKANSSIVSAIWDAEEITLPPIEEERKTPDPPPDHSDDNYSSAAPALGGSPVSSLLIEETPRVAVLAHAFAVETSAFLGILKEPYVLVNVDFSPDIVEQYPLLVIPTGGLYGLENSVFFRAHLEEYARRGGTIVAYAQQHGADYSVLPGGELGGYGWNEDNSCTRASLYISEYDPVLSGFDEAVLDSNVDGYFTNMPQGAQVLLWRTKNGQPAMVRYPYGAGTVIATTTYDDWGAANWQTTSDAYILNRDLMAWAVEPATLPEFDPGNSVALPVTVTNDSDTPAAAVQLSLLAPGKEIVTRETYSVTLPAGMTTTIPFATTAGRPLGIWRIDYTLLDADGKAIVPDIVEGDGLAGLPPELLSLSEAEWQMTFMYLLALGVADQDMPFRSPGARFIVKDPHPESGPVRDVSLTVNAPTEYFPAGLGGEFTFTINNNSAMTRTLEVRYCLPHHHQHARGVEYCWLSRTVVVGPNSYEQFVHVFPMETDDRLFANLYEDGVCKQRTWFQARSVPLSVDSDVRISQAEYGRGDTVEAIAVLDNPHELVLRSALFLRVIDPDKRTVLSMTRPITLTAGARLTETFSFVLPEHVPNGTFHIELSAQRDKYARRGSNSFSIPHSPARFYVSLPKLPAAPSDPLQVTVTNSHKYLPVAGALDLTIIDSGGLTRTVASQPYELAAGESVILDYDISDLPAKPEEYTFVFSAHDQYGGRQWRETRRLSLLTFVEFDRPSYRIRDTLGLTVTARNDGDFGITPLITATIPALGFDDAQTVFLAAGESDEWTYNLPLPESLPAGYHEIDLTVDVGGEPFHTTERFLVPEARVLASLEQTDYQAGDTIVVGLDNVGGVDATVATTLELLDSYGAIVARRTLTPSLLADGRATLGLTIPPAAASDTYQLIVNGQNTVTGASVAFRQNVTVSGVAASLSVRTAQPAYFDDEYVEARVVALASSGDIHGTDLNLRICTEDSESIPAPPVSPEVSYAFEPVPFDWVDIAAEEHTTVVRGPDYTQVALGFPFEFYGVVYTQTYVSGDGYITFFDSGFTHGSNGALPNVRFPNNAIYALWDDLDAKDPHSEGKVYARQVGPTRYAVQWEHVGHLEGSGTETFQLVLDGSDNSITLQYLEVSDTAGATVGVENLTGSQAIQLAYNQAGAISSGAAFVLLPAEEMVTEVTYGFVEQEVNWTDISSGTPVVGNGGAAYARVELGFPFQMDGVTHTQMYAGRNGFIAFGDDLASAAPIYGSWLDLFVAMVGADEDEYLLMLFEYLAYKLEEETLNDLIAGDAYAISYETLMEHLLTAFEGDVESLPNEALYAWAVELSDLWWDDVFVEAMGGEYEMVYAQQTGPNQYTVQWEDSAGSLEPFQVILDGSDNSVSLQFLGMGGMAIHLTPTQQIVSRPSYVVSPAPLDWVDVAPDDDAETTITSDRIPSQVELGFAFSFVGMTHTQAYLGPNGFISFGDNYFHSEPIYPLWAQFFAAMGEEWVGDVPAFEAYMGWDLLFSQIMGGVYEPVYAQQVSATQYMVQWQAFHADDTDSFGTFQVILDGSNDSVIMQFVFGEDTLACALTPVQQAGQPLSYEVVEIPFTWVDVAPDGEPIVALEHDACMQVDLEFPIDFYGQTYSEIYVCSDGTIQLDNGRSYCPYCDNESIPFPGTPNNAVYALWDSFDPFLPGRGRIYTRKVAPDRYVVQWNETVFGSSHSPQTFQAILDGTDDTITLQYLEVGDAYGATVGVENRDGTRATQAAYDQSGVIVDGLALQFTPSEEPATPLPMCHPDQPYPLDVVLVIDASSSMDGASLADAKNVAQELIDLLDPAVQRVGLVTLAPTAHLAHPLSRDAASVKAAVDAIEVGGASTIGQGIAVAHAELAADLQPGEGSVIILLSDGWGTAPMAVANGAKADGIKIVSIGLGASANEELLRALASTGGDYYHEPSISTLPAILGSIEHTFCSISQAQYEEGCGYVLWENTLPVVTSPSFDVTETVEPLNVTGQVFLDGRLFAETGQLLARDTYPFYLHNRNMALTLETDRDVYRPGDTIHITGRVTSTLPLETDVALEVWAGDQLLLDQSLTLPPGGHHAYSTVLTETESLSGRITLFVTANDMAVHRSVIVAEPVLEASLDVPSMVGSGPFPVSVMVTNAGAVPANAHIAIVGVATESLTLVPEAMARVEATLNISQDTTVVAHITGDLMQTLTATVRFGEAASLALDPEPIYPVGPVAVPYTLNNTGLLPVAFDAQVVLRSEGEIVDSQVLPLSVLPGESLSGTLRFGNLAVGEYTLRYDTPFESGSVFFSVLPLEQAHLTGEAGVAEGATIPLTATVTNAGLSSFNGTVTLQTDFFVTRAPVTELPSEQSLSLALPVDTRVAAAGDHAAQLELLDGAGRVVGQATLTLTVPAADLVLTGLPTNLTLPVSTTVTLTFDVANRGGAYGEGSLHFTFSDAVDEEQLIGLAGGEEGSVGFTFFVPPELEAKTYQAIYTLNGEQEVLLLTVEGVDIEVTPLLDRQAYREGQSALLTLHIEEQAGRSTLPMVALVRFNDYSEMQPLTLTPLGSADATFTVPVSFQRDEKVFYGIYDQGSNRAIHLNTVYLPRQYSDITVLTDKQVYKPGESVAVTIVTTATGWLDVAAPGFTTTVQLAGENSSFAFTLPVAMKRGTYTIDSIPRDCDCLSENQRLRTPFDVDGPYVRVTDAYLDEPTCEPGKTNQLNLTVASDRPVTTRLLTRFERPDGSVIDGPEQLVHLQDSPANLLTASFVPDTDQNGMHYVLYDFVDPDDETVVYSAGAEACDVGEANLSSVTTERSAYTHGESVQANVTLYATHPTSGHLVVRVDDTVFHSEPISLSGGFEQRDIHLGSDFAAGYHRVSAVLIHTGRTSTGAAVFDYGVDLPDLLISPPVASRIGTLTRTAEIFIANVGASESFTTTVVLYDGVPANGGQLLGTATVPALVGGVGHTALVPWSVSGREGVTTTLYAIVDPEDIVLERQEENNEALGEAKLPPRVEAGPDYGLTEGDTVSLTLTSFVGPNPLDTYTATVTWEDGTIAPATITIDGDIGLVSSSHTYLDDGQYTVYVQVCDLDNVCAYDLFIVTVDNAVPEVDAGSNRAADEGDEVHFDGTFTDLGALDAHTVLWDFGDGNTAEGTLTPTHIYSDDGVYTATLTVADEDGGVGSDTVVVAVANVAPVADAGPDRSASEGQVVAFSGVFTDPGVLDTHAITWDLGDGYTITGTLTPKHTYADDGVYTVTLTIADDDGGVGSDAISVTVENVPPDVDAGPDQVITTGETVQFSGVFTDVGLLDTHTILWDFGDGDTITGTLMPEHTYASDGVYTATLTVADDNDGVGSDVVQVVVLPKAEFETFDVKRADFHWWGCRGDQAFFIIQGELTLPDGYTPDDLTGDLQLALVIHGKSVSDTVSLEKHGNTWVFREHGSFPGLEDGMISKAFLWHKPGSSRIHFTLYGVLAIDGVDHRTRPAEATVSLSLGVDEDYSLEGEQEVTFRTLRRLWWYRKHRWLWCRCGCLLHFDVENQSATL